MWDIDGGGGIDSVRFRGRSLCVGVRTVGVEYGEEKVGGNGVDLRWIEDRFYFTGWESAGFCIEGRDLIKVGGFFCC